MIHYIGFYNEPGDIDERKPLKVFASTEKMNYIASVLSKKNKVRVVSPGFSTANNNFTEKNIEKEKFEVRYLNAFGDGKEALTVKKIFSGAKEIKRYIDSEVRHDDKIIFYSVPSMWLLLRNTLIKHKCILELEELYYFDKSIMNPIRCVYKMIENDAISRISRIIYVSDTLKKNVQKDGIVIYGPFESYQPSITDTKDKSEVNILYSGSIDETRGAFNLAKALVYISEKGLLDRKLNVRVSFVGYFHGKNAYRQRKDFVGILELINKNGIKAVFKENLSGDEMKKEIIGADICVMPQKISSVFSEYSFPSKLPRYLSYGKLVVSSAIKPVIESPFGGLVVPYYSDDADVLAAALVKAIDLVYSGEFCGRKDKILNEIRKLTSKQEKELLELLNW